MSSRFCTLGMTRMLAVVGVFAAMPLFAQEIGLVKTAHGTVSVERGGQNLSAQPGFRLHESDVVRTGADSAVGITFADNTLMSTGPNSTLALDRFAFNSTTHQGRFESSVRSGTLSVISGKIAKQSPEAMTVRTPATVLGVRGTEFFVQVGAGAAD